MPDEQMITDEWYAEAERAVAAVCTCMAETLPDGTCSECRKPAPRLPSDESGTE